MKLRRPFFIENDYRDQPYFSMVLMAPYCDFSCKGCQNSKFKHDPVENISINELISEYNSNKLYQGVTVEGLELFLSGAKFKRDLIEFLTKGRISNVTIYTRFTINDEKVKNFIDEIKNIETLGNIYLKTGIYKKNEESKICSFNIGGSDWEIELASSNQDFVKIK